jgi:hypothetical protein
MDIKILKRCAGMKPHSLPAQAWLAAMLLAGANVRAELIVKADEPKTTGNKTVIKLTLKNTFQERIESVRATVFLLDDQGKVAGQGVKWIIGGTKDKPPLAADATTTYNFVITSDKPFTKAKVTLNRIVLEGGKLADVTKPNRAEVTPK